MFWVEQAPLLQNVNMYIEYVYDHDVIKIGSEFLEQKGNVLCVVQPAMHSTLGVYDIHPLITICV